MDCTAPAVTCRCCCTVFITQVATGAVIHRLQGYSSFLRGLTFSPDGSRIASSGDTSIRLFQLQSSQTGLGAGNSDSDTGGGGRWSPSLLLSSHRSLTFTDAIVAAVTASAANKLVMSQFGGITDKPTPSPAAGAVVASRSLPPLVHHHASGSAGNSGPGSGALSRSLGPVLPVTRPGEVEAGATSTGIVAMLTAVMSEQSALRATVDKLCSGLVGVQSQQAAVSSALAAQERRLRKYWRR